MFILFVWLPVTLTAVPTRGFVTLCWAPDGKKWHLTFVPNGDGKLRNVLVDAATGKAEAIELPADARVLDWSGDSLPLLEFDRLGCELCVVLVSHLRELNVVVLGHLPELLVVHGRHIHQLGVMSVCHHEYRDDQDDERHEYEEGCPERTPTSLVGPGQDGAFHHIPSKFESRSGEPTTAGELRSVNYTICDTLGRAGPRCHIGLWVSQRILRILFVEPSLAKVVQADRAWPDREWTDVASAGE
jgi:hypothetical protein